MEQIMNRGNAYLLVGLLSLLSSGHVSGATLFQDDFNDGNAGGWTVVKDSGKTPAWSVISGGYNQLNEVRSFNLSFHKGSYAYYNSGFGFTDYQLMVDLTAATGESVGVMFRYRDNNNYYRFSINRNQGFAQLERKVNGTFKTLVSNGRGPAINQTRTVSVDVNGPNIFVYLDGEPLFGASDSSLSSGSIALFAAGQVKFDNVVVNTTITTPRLIISKPVSYFVETSGALSVGAIATQVPSGGGVRFALDNQRTVTDLTQPYSGSFSNVPAGDHTVGAVIVDGSKQPLADPSAADTNVVVGVRGRFFIGLGDSITNGVGDDIAGDDESSDERNASRGYTPLLNNLLTASLGLPITVVNEGFSGTEAGKGGASGLSRLGSTKTRHPESKYWLILFGTNDSGISVPSGKGLQPGNSGYAGSFKDSMQKIISNLKNSGKVPVLAKVPFIANAPASRDQLIQDYNIVIEELVTANNLAVTPPDFYNYFKQHPSELADDKHPNGIGYQSMADLWFDALIGSGLF
jgi:lysophospholipase L1-like esterase